MISTTLIQQIFSEHLLCARHYIRPGKEGYYGVLAFKEPHSRKVNNLLKFPRPSEMGAAFHFSLIALHPLPLCPFVC